MDVEARRIDLENQKAVIEGYLKHPVTVELLKSLEEAREGLEQVICDQRIGDISTFFAHFEAVGHMRALRQTKDLILTNLEDINKQLEEVNSYAS